MFLGNGSGWLQQSMNPACHVLRCSLCVTITYAQRMQKYRLVAGSLTALIKEA